MKVKICGIYYEQVEQALEGGDSISQLREKNPESKDIETGRKHLFRRKCSESLLRYHRDSDNSSMRKHWIE